MGRGRAPRGWQTGSCGPHPEDGQPLGEQSRRTDTQRACLSTPAPSGLTEVTQAPTKEPTSPTRPVTGTWTLSGLEAAPRRKGSGSESPGEGVSGRELTTGYLSVPPVRLHLTAPGHLECTGSLRRWVDSGPVRSSTGLGSARARSSLGGLGPGTPLLSLPRDRRHLATPGCPPGPGSSGPLAACALTRPDTLALALALAGREPSEDSPAAAPAYSRGPLCRGRAREEGLPLVLPTNQRQNEMWG